MKHKQALIALAKENSVFVTNYAYGSIKLSYKDKDYFELCDSELLGQFKTYQSALIWLKGYVTGRKERL